MSYDVFSNKTSFLRTGLSAGESCIINGVSLQHIRTALQPKPIFFLNATDPYCQREFGVALYYLGRTFSYYPCY